MTIIIALFILTNYILHYLLGDDLLIIYISQGSAQNDLDTALLIA